MSVVTLVGPTVVKAGSMNTNDIGWFEPLSKEIGEQGVVAMMVMIEARKIARLLGSTAKNPDTGEGELFPIATNVLTSLVASQLNMAATKERYCAEEGMGRSKAAIDEAVARYRREQEAEHGKQQTNPWETR